MTETLDAFRARIESQQLAALRSLLQAVAAGNRFYQPILTDAGIDGDINSLEEFCGRLPLSTKEQIVEDQQTHPPYGTNLTFPVDQYTRYHQTSGTTREPVRWLDTDASWQWMLRSWRRVFEAAGVTASDRVMFAFSFGPFLGFWTAFEAAQQIGCLCLPGGAMSSEARLRLMLANGATVLCCTPTYAIRLGQVAQQAGIDAAAIGVRRILVAGEPGGAVPATRQKIESLWRGARVRDHHGMTEVGPVTFPSPSGAPDVLHIIEENYLAEIIDPATGEAVQPGTVGELVLTTLGRVGSPLLRYRTGDLVCAGERRFETYGTWDLPLIGGILSRVDDMLVVRGVNVYPAAVEQVVRGCAGIEEYQVMVTQRDGMAELAIRVELTAGAAAESELASEVAHRLRETFALRVPVEVVPAGTLPRFEMKARRWIDAEGDAT